MEVPPLPPFRDPTAPQVAAPLTGTCAGGQGGRHSNARAGADSNRLPSQPEPPAAQPTPHDSCSGGQGHLAWGHPTSARYRHERRLARSSTQPRGNAAGQVQCAVVPAVSWDHQRSPQWRHRGSSHKRRYRSAGKTIASRLSSPAHAVSSTRETLPGLRPALYHSQHILPTRHTRTRPARRSRRCWVVTTTWSSWHNVSRFDRWFQQPHP